MDAILDLFYNLLDLKNLLTLVIAVLVFFTVITIVMPLLERQDLKKKAKLVTVEREKLRARQRAQLEAGKRGHLRDKPKGPAAQFVESLNLKKLLAADKARAALRKAGYRSETHLVTFLAARIIAPVVLGLVIFVYSSTLYADKVTPVMRVVLTLGGMGLGYFLPNLMVSNQSKKRQLSIKGAWSDALDLMLICVESGMSVEQALNKVSVEIATTSVPLAEEMQLTTAELAYLGERTQAFANLAKRTGLTTIKAVVTALIQSEKYGTPLGQALRVLAQENRDDRMAAAEKKAASLPPKLTVPMIVFFLPVLFVVILGPSILKVMMMNEGG